MKKAAIVMIATSLVTAPAHAAEWNESRPGTFIGARLTIGGKTGRRPTAAFTIAPAHHRISYDGRTSMRIGEGIAFNLSPGAKPTLTLAGVRADTALGLRPQAEVDGDQQLGMSDGAKVALGVGAAILVGVGITYVVLSNRCTECDQ